MRLLLWLPIAAGCVTDEPPPTDEPVDCLTSSPAVEAMHPDEPSSSLAPDDVLDVTLVGSDYSVPVSYRLTGLQLDGALTVLLRIDFGDGGTHDYPSSTQTSCQEDGWATYSASAPVPDSYQGGDLVGALDGRTVSITASFTDKDATTAWMEHEQILRVTPP